jgi:hypothetical protein
MYNALFNYKFLIVNFISLQEYYMKSFSFDKLIDFLLCKMLNGRKNLSLVLSLHSKRMKIKVITSLIERLLLTVTKAPRSQFITCKKEDYTYEPI